MKFFCLDDIHSGKAVTETKKRSKNTIEATFAGVFHLQGEAVNRSKACTIVNIYFVQTDTDVVIITTRSI